VKVSWDDEIPNGKMKILPNHQHIFTYRFVHDYNLSFFRLADSIAPWGSGVDSSCSRARLLHTSAAVSAVTLIAV
jgi:hypothetical protein